MKVHDDQLRDMDKGSPPLKYSPSVLVSILPESWLIDLNINHDTAAREVSCLSAAFIFKIVSLSFAGI